MLLFPGVSCVSIQSWFITPFMSLLVVTKPPYEITETGWGEFEIIIKIFFIDPNERPVSLITFNIYCFVCANL